MRTRIKICCIASVEEAELAIACGTDALGLVGKMPSGPGVISDDVIAAIVQQIPPPISSFLLTSEQRATDVVQHARQTAATAVQLVDELLVGSYASIRGALPYIKIVQVIHVLDENSINEAVTAAGNGADALLLDSGNPKSPVKTLGGTGNIHDWEISRRLVAAVRVPVFLAGGLHSGNVQEAIRIVKPFGVDICSGVRIGGRLDKEKLTAFITAVGSIRW